MNAIVMFIYKIKTKIGMNVEKDVFLNKSMNVDVFGK